MPASIFVVDSSPAVQRMIEQISSTQGYEVAAFQDGPTALEAARRMTPALIIADYHLADMTFSGFCKEVNKLDHLTETMLVSLVDSSERWDEQHLRSLGVHAFLKKPLRSDDVLDTLNGLKNGTHHKSVTPLKKRAWPPDSTATDLSAGAETYEDSDAEASSEPGASATEEPLMKQPTSTQTRAAETAGSIQRTPSSETAAGEDALRSLLDYLLQSVVREVEEKIATLLPLIVTRELTAHLAGPVREEVHNQLTSALSADRIEAALHGIVMPELTKQSAAQATSVENAVKQQVAQIAPALVEKTTESLLRRSIDPGLEKYVPQAVRTYLGPVDTVVKNEVREAVAGCARQTTEEIVREMAGQRIHEAVQHIVPDIAEAQVKEEIRRLTASQ
ncbi:MAG TPA: response regulator [Nitrospiraceae bacterium]|nr:response regulator [Nitrospiraceae bacterium]